MKAILKSSLIIVASLTCALSRAAAVQATALEFKITQRVQPSAPIYATPTPSNPVALNFAPRNKTTLVKLSQIEQLELPTSHTFQDLFAGDSMSLIAKTVGSAEGTRTPNGGYTSAYYGHVDPGNGVWNLGSFSYQHGASSPKQADRKQLNRLQQQALELRQQAQAKSINLSLLEELNGIDLANQAPLAALDRGYIYWLYAAKQQSMSISERIVWARTKAFIDPDTGYWDAPGLGNHWDTIYRDQLRRYDAIERALGEHRP